MDEETNKIKQHIDFEREQLGRNLDEIEYRVKSATDIRGHFNKHTGLILGAAVAGGFLLSLAVRKPRSSYSAAVAEYDSREHNTNTRIRPVKTGPPRLQRVTDTIDTIFDGLLGVASEKLHSFVADAVPGFRAQYDAIERQRGRSSVHQMKPNNPGVDSDLSAMKPF